MNAPFKMNRPKELTEYVLKNAWDFYGICDTKNGKTYFTCCENEWVTETGEFEHNEEIACPMCGKTATIKFKRYGRKKLEENSRVLWFQKRGKITYAQLDEFDIDYTGEKPEVSFWASAQYKFSKKECRYFKHAYWGEDKWIERKNIILPSACQGLYGWQMGKYSRTYIYMPSLGNMGSDLKHSNKYMIGEILRYIDDGPYLLIKYLDRWFKESSIEILEKSGFEDLVIDRCNGFGCIQINWKAANLRGVFRKFKPSQIKDFRKFINKPCTVTQFRRPANILKHYLNVCKKSGEELSFEDVDKIRTRELDETIETIQKYTTIKQAASYLERIGTRLDLNDYADYLRECEQLEKDLTNRKVLRPKDLLTAHEKTAKQYRDIKDEIINKKFIESEKEIAGDVEGFSYGNLIIKKANKVAELNKESDALNHCVSTYADKVAKKRSAILFIRKINEPDKPYFTLEIAPDGEILQCRGYCNCKKTADVEEFIDQWEKYIKKQKKEVA